MDKESLTIGIAGAILSVLFVCSMTVGVNPDLFFIGSIVAGLLLALLLIRKRHKKLTFFSLTLIVVSILYFMDFEYFDYPRELISIGTDNSLELSISLGILASVPWITILALMLKKGRD